MLAAAWVISVTLCVHAMDGRGCVLAPGQEGQLEYLDWVMPGATTNEECSRAAEKINDRLMVTPGWSQLLMGVLCRQLDITGETNAKP